MGKIDHRSLWQPDQRAHGLWSLLDIMQSYDATNWFLIARLVSALHADASKNKPNDAISVPDQVKDHLGTILNDCIALNLKVSSEVARRHRDQVTDASGNGTIRTWQELMSAADSISATIEAELDSIVFFRVSDEYAKYCQQSNCSVRRWTKHCRGR
jgi:hypothetical protein